MTNKIIQTHSKKKGIRGSKISNKCFTVLLIASIFPFYFFSCASANYSGTCYAEDFYKHSSSKNTDTLSDMAIYLLPWTTKEIENQAIENELSKHKIL